MSTITEITEFHDEKLSTERDWDTYEGWRVVTDDQIVSVGISNQPNCCEQWGYFSTDDDPGKYVGAELLRVERVDGDLKTIPDLDYGLEAGDAMFVNFVTSRGTFQLGVYNAHNGYYGHSAIVIGRDLSVSETL